jgi:hypothetical protein
MLGEMESAADWNFAGMGKNCSSSGVGCKHSVDSGSLVDFGAAFFDLIRRP